MPYIPPHKRAGTNSEPSSPPPRPRSYSRPLTHKLPSTFPKSSISYRPSLFVADWKSNSEVVLNECIKPLTLELVPSGITETYCHLQGKETYFAVINSQKQEEGHLGYPTHITSVPSQDETKPGNSTIAENCMQGLTLNETSEAASNKQVDAIEEKSLPLLLEAFENVTSKMIYLGPNKEVRGKLVLRFGKIMLFSPRKEFLDLMSINPVPASELEAKFSGRRDSSEPIAKSFETYLDSTLFDKLEQIAIAQATTERQAPQKFVLQIYDSKRNDSVLRVICTRASENSEDDGHSKLQINKVICDTLRELMLDVLPVNREASLRIACWTDTQVHELEGEEKEAIEAIVGSAIVDPSVKGGIRWQSRSFHWSNPKGDRSFSLRGVRFLHNVKKFKNERFKWTVLRIRNYELDENIERPMDSVEMRSRRWSRSLLQSRALPVDREDAPSIRDSTEERKNEIAEELTSVIEWLKENLP